ncbi:MAG: hypothetical protein H8D42_03610 [Candidatus Marinimicrobia bacterium]|nr:hypothetical protein [Candidatus Neomarinimicrobiota bacterium]
MKKMVRKMGYDVFKINARFLEMEWDQSEPNQKAAWELYIEFINQNHNSKVRRIAW